MFKLWDVIKDGVCKSYSLKKSFSPDWWAKVERFDGRWTFFIGNRETHQRFNSIRSYKSSTYARRKALSAVFWKEDEARFGKELSDVMPENLKDRIDNETTPRP